MPGMVDGTSTGGKKVAYDKNGFTLIEVVVIIVVVAIVGVFVAARYFNMGSRARIEAERGVVGNARTGIRGYVVESALTKRVPALPATLDGAADGPVSESNSFFTNVLRQTSLTEWAKSGQSYRGPTGNIYTYDPDTGSFATNFGLLSNITLSEGGGTTAGGLGPVGSFATIPGGNIPTWTGGQNDGALNFDGSGGYVHLDPSPDLDPTTSGTVQVWINPSVATQPSAAGLVHRGDLPSFSDETYSLQFWNGNRITLYLNDVSGNSYQVTTTSTFAGTGQWYLVTGTWDSAGMRIYVNGQLEASNAIPVTLKSTPAGGVNIGAQTTSVYSGAFKNFPFNGKIDSVSIFNRSLSAGEIMWNYDAPH